MNAPASPPRRFNCIAVVYADSAALRTPALSIIPGSSTAKNTHGHTRGAHHREPVNLDASACCAGANQIGWTAYRRTNRPPGNTPGLTAPKRKARSQKPVRPRKLWVTVFSLRASRVAAACRLRQSCRRNRGPVTLSRSGCPACRSQNPAALSRPAHAPPPAAPRASFRSDPAATPQSMPENLRAITQQQLRKMEQSDRPV